VQSRARATGLSGVSVLEDELGVRLFSRTTRSVTPTPAGERLLPLLRAAIDSLNAVEREAESIKRPGLRLLRVGFSPMLGARTVAELLRPCVPGDRTTEVVYKECGTHEMEQRLDSGTIDIVFGARLSRSKSRARQTIGRELLLFVPSAEQRAGRASVMDLSEVATHRLALTGDMCGLAGATRELFETAGLSLKEYAGRAVNYEALAEWAELGIAGAILPESHVPVRTSLRFPIRVGNVLASVTYEAVWRKDLVAADHLKVVLAALRRTTAKSSVDRVASSRVLDLPA
jgi:DNA-binding transcriptional LysR family regulator